MDLTDEPTPTTQPNFNFNQQTRRDLSTRRDSAHPIDISTASKRMRHNDMLRQQEAKDLAQHGRDHVFERTPRARVKREEVNGFEARPSIENHGGVANGGRYPSNRRPFTHDDQTPRRDHRSSTGFQHINVDMSDNDYLPQRSDDRTVRRQGSPDENGRVMDEDQDMMDVTPSRKRQRIEPGHTNGHGHQSSSRSQQQQQVAPTAPMTPRNRQPSHAHASSSSSSQRRLGGTLNLMGTQARSQLNGPSALSFQPSPSRSTTITEADLMLAFGELQSTINRFNAATKQHQALVSKLMADNDKLRQELKAQNDHMNKTFQEITENNKKAIQELHEKDSILEGRVEEIEEKSESLEPTRGGAFGGPKAIPQKEKSTGFFNLNEIVQQPQTQGPTAPPQQRTPQRPGAPPQQGLGGLPQQPPGPARGGS